MLNNLHKNEYQKLFDRKEYYKHEFYAECDLNDELRDRIELLEKALNKACEWLEFYDHLNDDGEYDDWKTKEQWKEWCLDDVG
jgi:hypothetical protein